MYLDIIHKHVLAAKVVGHDLASLINLANSLHHQEIDFILILTPSCPREIQFYNQILKSNYME